jgi:hypothetical protein
MVPILLLIRIRRGFALSLSLCLCLCQQALLENTITPRISFIANFTWHVPLRGLEWK